LLLWRQIWENSILRPHAGPATEKTGSAVDPHGKIARRNIVFPREDRAAAVPLDQPGEDKRPAPAPATDFWPVLQSVRRGAEAGTCQMDSQIFSTPRPA